jgi:GMP synthase (glutamine-hydrolysing)
MIPVHSVGVQGDSRTYKPILAIEGDRLHERAVDFINAIADVNRVVAVVRAKAPLESMEVHASALSAQRLDRLRAADAIVRELSDSSGFEARVWQFPVVLIPVGTKDVPDSVVLRPIHSVDGMTAQSVEMPLGLLEKMSAQILGVPGVAAVFYDLTNKPPATIEWE